jgi:hypothetical protein
VEARADLLERHRRALEAAEQKKRERLEKRERLAKLERQRVERLLGEADNLRKAETIRGYVTEVLKIKERTPAVGENDLRTWADWAPPTAPLLRTPPAEPVIRIGNVPAIIVVTTTDDGTA